MDNENGTIQTDVSAADEQQARPQSEREIKMQQIEDKLDGGHSEQQPAGTETETTDTAVPRVIDDLDMLVRVKVNGRDEQKSLADVLTGYQKNEAASERLRLAAAKEKQLDAREASLREIESQVQMQTQSSSNEDTDDADLATMFNAWVEGDTETAKKALRDAINKGRNPITTPQTIDEEALAGRVEQKLEDKKAWDTFLENNPEFSDTDSKERQYGDFLFDSKYKPLIEAGEISYHQALFDTANEVKSTLAPPPPPPPPKTERELKLERKRAIDNLPIAAGARQTAATAEPEETHTNIITQMRKGRGLPV